MRGRYRELNFSAHRVKIRIEGFRLSDLLTRAMEAGLDLRSIELLTDMKAECWASRQDLKKLKKLAGAKYLITDLDHRGGQYKLEKFLKAPMKAIGLALVLALVISQSFFVKTIQVSGYKAIPETQLRLCLEEAGIKEGAYIPAIDWQKAENRIYKIFPQVTWVQIVYDGRKVFLNVAEGALAEKAGQDQLSKSDRPYTNIVATQAGYIESASSYRGLTLVKEGDYVEAGQVLISGYVPIEATVFEEGWPKAYFVRSQGEVWAKVPYRLTFNQERLVRSTGSSENLVENKREKTEKEAKSKVNQQIRQWAKENLPENAQILNKDLNFCYKENIIEISVTLEVRQQIGEEQEIIIGEENSDSSGD